MGLEALLERPGGTTNPLRIATYLQGDFAAAVGVPRTVPFVDSFWGAFRPFPAIFTQPEIAAVCADSLRIKGERQLEEAGAGFGPHNLLLEASARLTLAYHAAVTGRPEEALEQEALASLMATPGVMTRTKLRYDPAYATLHDLPAVRRLIGEKG